MVTAPDPRDADLVNVHDDLDDDVEGHGRWNLPGDEQPSAGGPSAAPVRGPGAPGRPGDHDAPGRPTRRS